MAANALYFAISATGLFAVLLAWYEVFFLVKWVGAAYLVWLGVRSWRSSPAAAELVPLGTRSTLQGFVVQISNPKTLLFFGALLPQFVDVSDPVGFQLAILGATSIAIEFVVLAGYASLGSRLPAANRNWPDVHSDMRLGIRQIARHVDFPEEDIVHPQPAPSP